VSAGDSRPSVQSPAGPDRTRRTRFEYQTIASEGLEALSAALNALGTEAWEAIGCGSFVTAGSDSGQYFFVVVKRPIDDDGNSVPPTAA
jgi:hypothetical protein